MLPFYPGEKLLLGVLYRTPSKFQNRQQREQFEQIKNNISNAIEKFDDQGPVLVIGDWNRKSLEDAAPEALENFVDDSALEVLEPPEGQTTWLRARPGSGANDFGLCSRDNVIAAVRTAKLGLSTDHVPVIFSFLPASASDAADEGSREVWNKKGDKLLYQELLKEPVEECEQQLQQLLLSKKDEEGEQKGFDRLAEQLCVVIKDAGTAAYGKKRTVRANQSWSKQEQVLSAFRKVREAESALVDDLNSEENKKQLEEAKRNFEMIKAQKEEEAWSSIRNKVGSSDTRKLLQILLPSDMNNLNLLDIQRPDSSPCSSKADAAEVLVSHYAEVCSLPDNPSFDALKKRQVEECISNIQELDVSEELQTDLIIAEQIVSTVCKKLNRHSAAGPDDVPPFLLVDGGSALHSFLAHFFSALLQRGYAPSSFRLAYIFPIFKGEKNSRSAPASYRPISLTSVVSKLMERCVLPLLQSRIEPFLSPLQAGFRSGYSTKDQIYRLSRAIFSAIGKRATLPVAFLDLSKAFDRVWIDGLLFKAHNYGVTGKLWRWLKSFLSNRSICVSCQGVISSPREITAGVPQGCVLSPTLFLVFINDLIAECKTCHPALFADDIGLWPCQLKFAELKLQQSLDGLSYWASQWRMIFNVKKSSVVLFRPKERKNEAASLPSFLLSGQPLPITSSYRYLGVIFEEHGRWNAHFQAVLQKVRYAVHQICKIIRRNQHPTMPIICELIKTKVQPIISYGFPIVHFTKVQERKLNSLIILPIKRSLSVFRTTSHSALFISSRLLDVEALWSKTALSFAHRLHKLSLNPASELLGLELFDRDHHGSSSSTSVSAYTLSFVSSLHVIETQLGLKHDAHFSSQQLKNAAAIRMMKNMLAENSHAPFLAHFDVSAESPSRLDHHLRSDPPAVIALRSRLRLNSTVFNGPLHKRKMIATPYCIYCPTAVETIDHVLLFCPHYNAARAALFIALGFKPPDDYLLRICLGRTDDRKLKGSKPTRFERASSSFLLEIARLRPEI